MANTLGSLDVPAATRSRGPGWRDPRLWIGIVIVAASVVGGARLFAAADDSVAVWATTASHGAGDRLDRDDLAAVRVRFGDDATLDGYWTVDDTLPGELVLSRGVEAGELLPRASIGAVGDSDLAQVPLAVDPELVPGSVRPGAVVDVYLVAATATQTGAEPGAEKGSGEPVLSGVTVLEAPRPADSFGTSGKRQLVVAVPQEAAGGFFRSLGSIQSPVITIVLRG